MIKEDYKTPENPEDLWAALKRGDDLEEKLKDLEQVISVQSSDLDAYKNNHESLSSRLEKCKRQYELDLKRLENERNQLREKEKVPTAWPLV
eukprot:TRINITY_DN9574_c0_g1_i1.p1 TRINITY_DN9574_c0_g1~~TRINITY_DN9574_c0_g1_i1.p1  ORF type:complete len:101 (+),score=41.10 TRINITY_DN9574_c0_g1_i1:30-305(+)